MTPKQRLDKLRELTEGIFALVEFHGQLLETILLALTGAQSTEDLVSLGRDADLSGPAKGEQRFDACQAGADLQRRVRALPTGE